METKEQVELSAQQTWERVNNEMPNRVNPTPFILGFKYGVKHFQALKKEDYQKVRHMLCLMNSMIASGESHSTSSSERFKGALSILDDLPIISENEA